MRIGIIGAGQLGQMLGNAAQDLGFECGFIDPSDAPPAASTGAVIQKAFDDPDALAQLAADCDVLTYEFENVPVEALHAIADVVPVYPPPSALAIAQDRLHEKRLFDDLGIPLPGYRVIDSRQDMQAAADDLGLPMVVKTRRFGYDGKGQAVIRDLRQVDAVWDQLGKHPLIAEEWVRFEYEVSVIGVRNSRDDVEIWPLTQNKHIDGILHSSVSPVENQDLFERASVYMNRMLSHLDYVGVLALELFVFNDELLANEFAPRVHNSGHWTIEGADTSQFTNHLLAITGQPPASTACSAHAGMLNLVGEIPAAARKFEDKRISLHDYDKTPRPGRKLGHITVLAASAAERDELLETVIEIVTESTLAGGHAP